jgi:hypothetical protein
LSFSRKWLELEIITLSETNQTQRSIACFLLNQEFIKKDIKIKRGTIWKEEEGHSGWLKMIKVCYIHVRKCHDETY